MQRELLNFALQQVDRTLLAELSHRIQAEHQVRLIQKPTAQTLLLPVHDPVVNGTFFGGEVLVTSVIVRVNECEGWSMVMDEDGELAIHVAVLDGAWAAEVERGAVEELAMLGQQSHEQHCRRQAGEVAKTRVSFDLM